MNAGLLNLQPDLDTGLVSVSVNRSYVGSS